MSDTGHSPAHLSQNAEHHNHQHDHNNGPDWRLAFEISLALWGMIVIGALRLVGVV